ncbi:T9SS type A sorting domain-containing protein [Hymenobacter sp. 5516J-16]|uniref:T9SS type A sorting domain-containing protein n=1 Tax=Hymenobacter sp. 5516J-16 TaxID=2932253 RepID=UPI001FD5B7DC|nr:T9SS type A sorting domain-containing protein [Hymenobacter sp. 5516J-16]UOQ76326.1 T9SS type A sorting domain-containing protein [Hymenobacter sp. 5516J-16]
MKAITLALALFLLLGNSVVQAQNTQAHQGAPARKELREYYQQNVLPTVRQQRQKLEAQLTTSDKAQLTLYRAQLKETRQKGKALRQSLRPAGTPAGTRPELTETQKQQLQQLRAETKAILQNVSQLAQKYEGDIAKLAQEVQPQREKWAADTKAILARTATPEQQQKRAAWLGKRQRHAGTRRYFQPVTFLLLNPNASAKAAAGVERTNNLGVYPNPAVSTSQLEYGVKKAGPVTVELLDGRGNTLRTVAQETKVEKGEHTLAVNVADLPAGTYYFKITTSTGSETRRFVKQ